MKKTHRKQTAVAPKPESSNFVPLAQSDIDSMSYNQMDGLVTDGCKEMVLSYKKAKAIRKILEPVIIRMHGLLTSHSQGARTDLADAPTWEGWMKKHEAFGSPRTFYRILAKAKVLPPRIGDAFTTPDGNPAKISHIHSTVPNKLDVEEMVPNANQPVVKTYNLDELKPRNPKPFYCAKTVHDFNVDVAASAAQKAVRDGDEGNGCYWIRELYWTNYQKLSSINIWKKLFIFYGEEIGLADLSLPKEIIELERKANEALEKHLKDFAHMAEKAKDGRHSDLLYVINAMMLLCRAKKSRAADNAILWFEENPTYVPPTPEKIEYYATADLPTPVIPDKVYDKHTAKGRKMKRGLDHFLKEAAVLANESNVAGFQAPAPETPFLTGGGL